MKRFAAAILVSNNKILLGKRNPGRDFYPGVWDMIGGHCLENESFEDAIERECREELDIHLLEFRLLAHVDESPRFIMKIFVVTVWKGEPANADPREHEEIAWFTISEAKQLKLADERYMAIFQEIEDSQKLT